jgi:hypothetical protein
MSTTFDAGAIHEALVTLEELALVSLAVADKSPDAVELGFVASDPRTRPEKIMER